MCPKLCTALFRDSNRLIKAEYPLFVFSVFTKPQQISSFRATDLLQTLKALTDCTQEAARKDVWVEMSSSSVDESSFMTPVSDSDNSYTSLGANLQRVQVG